MKNRDHEGDAEAMQRFALGLLAFVQAGGKIPMPPQKPKSPPRVSWRHVGVGSALVLFVVSLVWIGGNIFAIRYDLQGTLMSARNSDGQLQQMVRRKADAYHLRIQQPDGVQQVFSLRDAGLQMHVKSSVESARQQQRNWDHRLQWWKPITMKVILSADTKALQAFVAERTIVTIEPAKDATITITDGLVQLTDGVAGKQYGLPDPAHTILEAASSLRKEPLRMREIAQQPAVTAQALAETRTKLDAALKQPIVFTIDGQQIRPDAREVARWITLAPDKDKGMTIGVSGEKVQQYVDNLSDEYDRPPRTQVSLGGRGTIPGVTGLTILNKETAIANVTQNLLAGKGLSVDLPTRQTPYKTITASAAGKWIEVDITTKRMYVYRDTVLERTFLISAGAPATPTVTGTFAIFSKQTRQTMSGPNADGSRYVQPNVPWVNYFYRDYAIHGNYWRPIGYFGNVNSSHGCVGLTPGDAAWVYNWAPVGTPVVIHT